MPYIEGSTKTHTTLSGTPGDDLFLVPAAFTTVNGDGGSDVIVTESGYDTINLGTFEDGLTGLTEVLSLAGPGNTVEGAGDPASIQDVTGDEDFVITDLSGGANRFLLGNGNNTVLTAGNYNYVQTGSATATLKFLGSNNTVFNNSSVSNAATTEIISFSGVKNDLDYDSIGSPGFAPQFASAGKRLVTGGNGYSNYNLERTDTTLDTSGLYNTIEQTAGTADITPGTGHDTVLLLAQPSDQLENAPLAGIYAVHLLGSDNSVSAFAQSFTADGGNGFNSFDLAAAPDFDITNAENAMATPDANPLSSYTVDAGGAWNSFTLSDLDSNTITTGGEGAHVNITSPTGPFSAAALHPATSITLGGAYNTVQDQGGEALQIVGGTGYGLFALGYGDDVLDTSGQYNTVTADPNKYGIESIAPGSGHDTVTLNLVAECFLDLSGTGNNIFLRDVEDTFISGATSYLTLSIGPENGSVTLSDFASDLHATIDLIDGIGGYTSAAQATAALYQDGPDTLLPIDGSLNLVLGGVTPAEISPALFVIKP